MRFLHVSHQYPPALGGSERYIADLSEELVKRGHRVDVATTRSRDFHTWRNELPGFERRHGVNVYRFRSLFRRGSVWRMLHFGLRHYWQTRSRLYEPFIFLGGGPISPGIFWYVLRHGRQYDLIHLNCLVYAHVTYGYWAARLLNVPVAVTPHLHPEQEVTYNIGYQRRVLAGSDHILAVTPAEKSFLTDLNLDLNPQQITVTGNGLRTEHYSPGPAPAARRKLGLPQDKFILLFLSRKSAYKGLELALKAFTQLQSQHPDLVFVAAGPETQESRAMWPRYRDLENLCIMDSVTEEEKLALLQACDCLVLPSTGEAFGIVYLEAWIMGKPVIGARTVAVSAVIDEGQDGLLADPNDPDDLAKRIQYLVDHPQQRQKMGQRGREKVLSRYTVSHITDRLEDAYRRTLQVRGLAYE